MKSLFHVTATNHDEPEMNQSVHVKAATAQEAKELATALWLADFEDCYDLADFKIEADLIGLCI